jgi:hypothetical protein
MTLLRTGLIFIGGGACGAGLAAAFFSLTPTQAALPNARPQPAAEAAVDAQAPLEGETRTVFSVTGEERAHIQNQMLEFLIDLQNLNTALADSDREWIHEIASAQGAQRAPDTVGQQLRKKAPEGFSQISQSLRSDFSALAEASESESIEELQMRVSLVTAKCVACHGSYTVATQSAD